MAKGKNKKYAKKLTLKASKNSATIKKLKKGTYYFKVRAFAKSGSKRRYGSYSKAKKIRL